MVGLQILTVGFAISALCALGAVVFTLIFGVSGVLSLAHGGIMVVAALIGWFTAGDLGAGTYGGSLLGILAGLVCAYATYLLVVRQIQPSTAFHREYNVP